MWDRSYRWQRSARVLAGTGAVCAALIGLARFSQTDAAARSAQAVKEAAREADPENVSRVNVRLPADLGVRQGVLVHREREDGAAEIVGRVIAVRNIDKGTDEATLMLTPEMAKMVRKGAILKGAAPTVSLEMAVRLLLAPDIPRDEAAIARDALWPTLKTEVLPGITSRIETELVSAAQTLDEKDQELLRTAMDQLHKDLAPLEEKLLNRLAERSWEVIGVSGVAEGVVRKAADGAGNSYKAVKDWVKGIFGEKEETPTENRDFLSEEKKIALRLALEEETKKFWDDHRKEIVDAVGDVIGERKDDFAKAFNERWVPRLYEKAVVPAWFDGEKSVIKAAEAYAVDFSKRRLLTQNGGPRLLLAHALRGALHISDAPLLVLASSEKPGVKFEYLIPPLDGEGLKK